MKKILLFILCVNFSIALDAQAVSGSFEHDGIDRDYMLFIPDGFKPGNQWPLVINLHGITSNAFEQSVYSGFGFVADTAKFILCHPNGTDIPGGVGKQWNVNFPLSDNTIDDVGFISELIDTLHANYKINLDKVYITGMSNGGFMAYKLACELTDKITAIASVTGSMVPEESMNCKPSKTIPVMQIHGTSDPTVAYQGSIFAIPTEDLVAQWVEHNNCALTPDTFLFPDINSSDMTTVERISYTDCDDNTKVIFYRVDGGGHTWPGSNVITGVTNKDISASSEIWNFFKQYGSPKWPEGNTSDILVSPNPMAGKVRIAARESTIEKVRVTNTLGQLMYEQDQVNFSEVELDLGFLHTGVYIVIVDTSDGLFSEPVLKL